MKKIILLIGLLSAIAADAQNLILNASAEEPMMNGEIPNWTETIGNSWIATNDVALFNFEANSVPDGAFWFWAGNNVQNVEGSNVSELEQIIDVSIDASAIDQGIKNYFFSAYTRSYEQGTNDQSNIFIDFLDVDNSLLTSSAFGPFSDGSSWINVNSTIPAPVNARKIRIKLHTVLRNGSDNDGCYDNLYLESLPNLGVPEASVVKPNLLLFPNPSKGIFNIKSDESIRNSTITVADLNGRIVYSSKTENLNDEPLNLSNLQSGIYILNIKSPEFNLSQKLIKQ